MDHNLVLYSIFATTILATKLFIQDNPLPETVYHDPIFGHQKIIPYPTYCLKVEDQVICDRDALTFWCEGCTAGIAAEQDQFVITNPKIVSSSQITLTVVSARYNVIATSQMTIVSKSLVRQLSTPKDFDSFDDDVTASWETTDPYENGQREFQELVLCTSLKNWYFAPDTDQLQFTLSLSYKVASGISKMYRLDDFDNCWVKFYYFCQESNCNESTDFTTFGPFINDEEDPTQLIVDTRDTSLAGNTDTFRLHEGLVSQRQLQSFCTMNNNWKLQDEQQGYIFVTNFIYDVSWAPWSYFYFDQASDCIWNTFHICEESNCNESNLVADFGIYLYANEMYSYFVIMNNNISLIGQIFTFRQWIQFSDGSAQYGYPFTIYFIGIDCASATYTVPTILDVTLSYDNFNNVVYWDSFTDSESVARDINQSCGVWSYKWYSQSGVGPTTGVNQLDLGDDRYTYWVLEWTTQVPASYYSKNTLYAQTVQGYLDGIYVTEAYFNIIFECKVQFLIVDTPMITAAFYEIGGILLQIFFPTHIQQPACGDPYTYRYSFDSGEFGLSAPSWLYIDSVNQFFVISTIDLMLVGYHDITIEVNGINDGLKDVQYVGLQFELPAPSCSTTSWNPNSISDMATTVLADPLEIQTFTEFNVLFEGCGTITYTLNPALSFVTIDPVAMTIIVAPTVASQVAIYSVNLEGMLNDYPGVAILSVAFTITVDACVLTRFDSNVVMLTPVTCLLNGYFCLIDYPSYTQIPACGYDFLRSITLDGSTTFPIWFIPIESSQKIRVQSTDLMIAGDYRVQVTTSVAGLSQQYVEETIITWLDQCKGTAWNPQAVNSMSSTVLGPSDFQTFLAFSTFDPCGLIKYELITTESFITLDELSMTITLAPKLASQVGVYSVGLKASLIDDLSNFSIVTFAVTVDICVIVSLTSLVAAYSLDQITSAIPITIFDAAFQVQLATYSQTPNCGYTLNVSLWVDTAPTASTWVQKPLWDFKAGDASVGEVYTADYLMDGVSYVLMQKTYYPTQISDKVERLYTFTDPCMSTLFQSQILPDVIIFVGVADSRIVSLPLLADSVSLQYSNIDKACFTQTVALTIDPVIAPYTSVVDNQMAIAVIKDDSLIGEYQIDAKYTLDRYPSISFIESFKVKLFALQVPNKVDDQEYQITSIQLKFNSNVFTIPQIFDDQILFHTVTLSYLSALPNFITYQETSGVLTFTVLSQDNKDAGSYVLLITATFTSAANGVTISSTRTILLKVIEADVITLPEVINQAPFFVEELPVILEAYVGKEWSYTLPKTLDSEESEVTATVALGTAVMFMTFDTDTFSIKEGVSLEAMVFAYALKVTLRDTQLASRTYQITFNLLSTTAKEKASEEDSESSSEEVTSSRNDHLASVVLDKSDTAAYAALMSFKGADGFDWGAMFAAALMKRQNKESQEIIDPVASLSKITKLGEVQVTFSQTMIVPPLDVMRKTFVKQNGLSVPAVQLVLAPGFYSNPDNLTFTYNITSYTPDMMTLQLDFKNSLLVSSLDDPDNMIVKFNAKFFFFSEYGRTILQDQLSKEIPRQQATTGFAAALEALAGPISSASSVVTAGNLAINIILSASLQQLWNLINTQQIIVLMPLFQIKMPPNAGLFFGFIMQIAAFDILPTDDFYADYTDIGESDPINDNFDSVGFSSLYLLLNLGSMAVAIACLPLVALFIIIIKPFRGFNRVTRLHNKLKKYMTFGHPITVFYETYTVMAVCSLINITNANYDTVGKKTSTILAMIFFTLCLILPVVFTVILWLKFPYLQRPRIKTKYGALYEQLNLKRGRAVILQPLHYFLRRMLLAVVIVCQDHLIVQIFAVCGCFVIQLMILGHSKPFKEPFTQRMEYFNEVVMLLTMYCMMCFTDFVPNVEIQFNIGWVCCFIVSIHFLINLFFMFKSNVYVIGLRLKRCKKQRAHKRAIQNRATTVAQQQSELVVEIQLVNDRKERKEIVSKIGAQDQGLQSQPSSPQQRIQRKTPEVSRVDQTLIDDQLRMENYEKFKVQQLGEDVVRMQNYERMKANILLRRPSEELQDIALTNKQFLDQSRQFIRRQDIRSFQVFNPNSNVNGQDKTVNQSQIGMEKK